MKVAGRSKDINDDITGSYDPNPFLNTLTYHVEFPDGEIKECSANVIAENTHARVDEDAHDMQILDAIVDHRKDSSAVHKAGMCIRAKSG